MFHKRLKAVTFSDYFSGGYLHTFHHEQLIKIRK